MRALICLMTLSLLLASCGESEPSKSPGQEPPAAPTGSGGGSHHGSIVALGTVELGGETFGVAREGECLAGAECGFAVARIGPGTASALYLWIENAAGEQISAPAQGDGGDGEWHFHVTAGPDSEPDRAILRLRGDGKDERAAVPLHAGAAPHHGGVCAPLHGEGGEIAGWLELKLHDDKGDLELWLATDAPMTQPLDLPLDTIVSATFPALGDRSVALRVRNTAQNEDEDGKPNIRSGKTNYFIFPGDTGADASWLMGADFVSKVTVKIEADGKTWITQPLALLHS